MGDYFGVAKNASIVTELAHAAGHDEVTYTAKASNGFWTISVKYGDGVSKELWCKLTDKEAFMALTGITHAFSNYVPKQL